MLNHPSKTIQKQKILYTVFLTANIHYCLLGKMEASTKNMVFFRSFLQALKPFTPKSVMKF